MTSARATLSNLRQSPRKVRLVADLVRGKHAEEALVTLQFADKRAAEPVRKLIESAIANAKSLSLSIEDLAVDRIEVNEGKILYRRRPAARGSAHPIRKRTSQIFVLLSPKARTKKVKVTKETK